MSGQSEVMLKELLSGATVLNATDDETPADELGWENVRRWVESAGQFERGRLLCQIMAGLGLLALHEEHEIQRGHNQMCHDGTSNFGDIIRKELSVSRRTAYRWMNLARALKARCGTVPGSEAFCALLNISPRDWTQAQTERVTTFLTQLTSGVTAVDFIEELGLTRSTAALPAPAADGAAAGTLVVLPADRQWCALERKLIAYEQRFEQLGAELVKAQIESLTSALNVRRLWLEQREVA